MQYVFLVIMDWYGNGDGVQIHSVFLSEDKAYSRVKTLLELEPQYEAIYVQEMRVET